MGAPLVRRKFNIKLLLVRKQRHPRTLNECSISGVVVVEYRAAISTKAAPP
jgi:hypothetical protein